MIIALCKLDNERVVASGQTVKRNELEIGYCHNAANIFW